MNELQKKLLLYVQIKEKILAETFINYPEEHKRLQMALLHKYAMDEFRRLGNEKLSTQACSPECFLCHPDLLKKIDQDFKKN